eukprot:CCRYP_015615-RA/>CCRYP_015615-RA protein AED:0.38 eAED:0.38 QI:0/0/0/1/0/0/3/0/178
MTYQEQNQLSYEYLCEKRQGNKQLLALQQKCPNQYLHMNLDNDVNNIICYMKRGQDPDSQLKIVLPASMLDKTVKDYERHYKSNTIIRSHDTQYTIDRFKCSHCQMHKFLDAVMDCSLNTKYKEEVAINLIGPWTVKVNRHNIEFNVLSCINNAFNLVELVRTDNKTLLHIRNKFMRS